MLAVFFLENKYTKVLNVDSKISLKPYLFRELSWMTEGTSDEWKEKWAQTPANYGGKLVEAHPKTFEPSHTVERQCYQILLKHM